MRVKERVELPMARHDPVRGRADVGVVEALAVGLHEAREDRRAGFRGETCFGRARDPGVRRAEHDAGARRTSAAQLGPPGTGSAIARSAGAVASWRKL